MQGAYRLSVYKNILFVTSGKYSKIRVPVYTKSMSLGKTCRVLLQCEVTWEDKRMRGNREETSKCPIWCSAFQKLKKTQP